MSESKDGTLDLEDCTTTQDILEWLEGSNRKDVMALCIWVNNRAKIRIPTSGTLDQLIWGLRKVPFKILMKGIELIFEEDDDEDCDETEEDGEAPDVEESEEPDEIEDEPEGDDDDEPEPPPRRRPRPFKVRF